MLKITDMTVMTASATAANDVLPIVDVSLGGIDDANKKITLSELRKASAYQSVAPAIVQSARNSTRTGSPQTVTLPATATAGNLLIALITGYSTSYAAVPTGWAQIEYNTSVTNQLSQVLIKTAAGTETSVSFTAGNSFNPVNIALIEVSGVYGLEYKTNSSSSGNTIYGTTVFRSNRSMLVLCAVEQDYNSNVGSVDSKSTLLYNYYGDGTNHTGAVLYSTALTASATDLFITPSVTFASSIASPVATTVSLYGL